MDRADLSSAIIQEMQALVGEALEAVVLALPTLDLATLEQRVQQVGWVILGQLMELVDVPRDADTLYSLAHGQATPPTATGEGDNPLYEEPAPASPARHA
jgi:hypothetical protein